MNSPKTAQLEANTEHLNAEQSALFATLNKTQQAAFLVAFPAPVPNTGPLYPVITFKGVKLLGIPTWKLAKSFIGGGKLADVIDAGSAAIKAGELTTAAFNAMFGMELVHSDDADLDNNVDGAVLDTAAARATREARDAEYRATHPRNAGNGVSSGFTPVP